MNPALNSSVKHDWMTPDNVLELVRQVGPIALDPCTTWENPTGAGTFIFPDQEDGLDAPWARYAGRGLTYVNPPYGRALPFWVKKCVEEAEQGAEIVLLVPARTDTRWAARVFETADVVAFWKGRMRFKGAPASAPFPTMLAFWAGDFGAAERFSEVFAPHAHIWWPRAA